MKRWALASAAVLAATVAGIALIFTSPDWLPSFCSSSGDDIDCGSVVSPLLVGFAGIVASAVLLFIGFMRGE